jgi:predicted CXXCH cytochrome family protein
LHPPATDGCTECHQPHASANDGFLLAPARPLCLTCHGEIGTQLETEVVHAPAEGDEGCLTCHGPHTTGHPSLLLSTVADTCLACHDGGSSTFAEKHLGFAASSLDCRECHDPHASAMAGMLLPEVHPPFAEGDCTLCHTETRGATGGLQ